MIKQICDAVTIPVMAKVGRDALLGVHIYVTYILLPGPHWALCRGADPAGDRR
jgi:hypothetical protein